MAEPTSASGFDADCQDILTRCACEALRRTSRTVTARYMERLRDVEVTAAQLPILVAAQLAGPVPVGALAAQLLMDRTTLTRNLVGLQEAHLVTVQQDVDRRVRLVALTAAGRRTLRRAIRAWREAQSQMESLFGGERMSALVRELESLARAAAG